METLPLDVLGIICDYLDIISIVFLSGTCKRFKNLNKNKNITKKFNYPINKVEYNIGIKINDILKYKKTSLYNCMNCGDLSNKISDLIVKCKKCKNNICKKDIYIGGIYSFTKLENKNVYCLKCIPNDKFINKIEKKYIIDFYSPQGFNRNEWYKKSDKIEKK